jgi:hypothetical protein
MDAPGTELSPAFTPFFIEVPDFCMCPAGAWAPGDEFGCELSANAPAGIAIVAATMAKVASFIRNLHDHSPAP